LWESGFGSGAAVKASGQLSNAIAIRQLRAQTALDKERRFGWYTICGWYFVCFFISRFSLRPRDLALD
jgi:hypothetical protein